MNKPSKRIIKSLLKSYAFAGFVLSVALMELWGYKTQGYISSPHGGPRIYGEEARAICSILLLVSSGLFIFLIIFSLMKLRTKEEREHYLEQLEQQPQYFICLYCEESFQPVENTDIVCPNCGSRKVEKLEGFYERHSERKGRPSADTAKAGPTDTMPVGLVNATPPTLKHDQENLLIDQESRNEKMWLLDWQARRLERRKGL